MDDNQMTINEKGTGFKGFIPAVFGRLVSESFNGLAKGEAEIKITAPPDLVRNRKALPDAWETKVIETKLLNPDWPHGQPYSATVDIDGRTAYRIAVPEYYTAVLSRLPRDAKGRTRHYRLSKRGPQARRPRRRHEHHPVSLRLAAWRWPDDGPADDPNPAHCCCRACSSSL